MPLLQQYNFYSNAGSVWNVYNHSSTSSDIPFCTTKIVYLLSDNFLLFSLIRREDSRHQRSSRVHHQHPRGERGSTRFGLHDGDLASHRNCESHSQNRWHRSVPLNWRIRGRRVFISIVRIADRLQRTICTWSTLFDVVKRNFSVFLTFLPYLHACYLRLSWKMSFTWSVSVMEASILDTRFFCQKDSFENLEKSQILLNVLKLLL